MNWLQNTTSAPSCSPKVTWAHSTAFPPPSLSGSSIKTSLGGTVPYSDALWYNQLIGDFSTQGLPDVNKTLVPTFHHFIYDVYFFGSNVELAEAIEFDINHFTAGRGYIYGTECRIVSGHVWAIWDNPHNRWINTPIACHPKSNEWNHLVIEVERTTDNKLLYKIDHAERKQANFELVQRFNTQRLARRDGELPNRRKLQTAAVLYLSG